MRSLASNIGANPRSKLQVYTPGERFNVPSTSPHRGTPPSKLTLGGIIIPFSDARNFQHPL